MRYCLLVTGMLLGLLFSPAEASEGGAVSSRPLGQGRLSARGWLSQDLRLEAGELFSEKAGADRHLLVCREGFELAVAGQKVTCQDAVVRIEPAESETEDDADVRYEVEAYLTGGVSVQPEGNDRDRPWRMLVVEGGKAVVVRLSLSGEVFISSDNRQTTSPQGLLLYRKALAVFEATESETPEMSESSSSPAATETASDDENANRGFTVSIAPLTEIPLRPEITKDGDVEVITIMGRIYAWWRQEDEEEGPSRMIELQADNIVLWRYPEDPNQPQTGEIVGQQGGIGEVYVSGDVQLREGERTIRASELYYDLRYSRGLAADAVLQTYDAARKIPVYVRAAELRQTAANQFEAEDITLTTSEFHTPQMSITASRVQVIDNTADTEQSGGLGDGRFDAQMDDVRFKYYDTTLFAWPSLRPNFQRPDVPIRSVRIGNDSTYGNSIETRWFLSRLLGLREPEGTESTLALDYFSDRGAGGGVDVEYERENYFGRVLGYVIDDHGEDRLSRTEKDVEVAKDTRGRFAFQHRHFLPYSWQLTAEASYLSDENFLQQFYRGEFVAGKEQETLLHVKRIEDNWGLSLLGKARVNDFLDKVEEQPTAEFHWTGQSFFDDQLTFYSDNQVSRYRYLYGTDSTDLGPESFFTYTMTRNEVDMPLAVGKAKIVPYVAGTFGYEDGQGFQATLDNSPAEPQDAIWLGEGGVRMSTQPFWKVYPHAESKFWDINQLRHVIQPQITAVAYTNSDRVDEQRDTLDFGISQRWQTKRGPEGRQRTVDWLRLDVDFVWVNNSGDATAGPDQFIWNKPFIPLANRIGSVLLPGDRRTTGVLGPRRNYVGGGMALLLSDTTAILGDMNIDMQSGVAQQIDVGISRLCWPNLSYYVGSRYLRRVESGEEYGSNAVTFAATYVIDPRYTAVFSQQYDFDYGAGIRSDITLIRKYHRMNLALTVGSDESLDERRIVLSLWPQGVPELAIGQRRYTGLGESGSY